MLELDPGPTLIRMSWPRQPPMPLHPHELLESLCVPGLSNTFALGCFARYQTLYSQQVRAINLADALSRTGLLVSGQRVLVAGGGIAGMTAAVAARMRGASVTLVEPSEQLIPFQRASTGRYLHPYAYDWPFVDYQDLAPLPFMSWDAGIASKVFAKLELEFRKQVKKLGGIEVKHGLELVAVTARDDRLYMNVRPNNSDDPPQSMEADTIVLAIGFGRELRYRDMPGYWDGDGLASLEAQRLSWLVSGGGDGALTDLIRLLVQDFNHQKLIETLLSDRGLTEELAGHLRESRTTREAFDRVSKSRRDALLEGLALRSDTRVRFCAPKDTFLESQDSCVLNRFLVYLLEDHVTFQPGRLAGIPDYEREAEYPYRVTFVSASEGSTADPVVGNFHGVIARHGVETVADDGERIPKVWASSEGLLDIWQHCHEVRAKWRAGSKFDDRTRVRIFHDDFAQEATSPERLLPPDHARERLRVLVVSSTSPVPPGARALDSLVHDATGSFEKKLKQVLQLGRNDALHREFGGITCEPTAFSRRWLERATRQLCRADVVFFDISEYQPLVMLLLGVRAAARRGVNILCTYEEGTASFWSRLPFNIKEMHPLDVGPRQEDPQQQVGHMLLDALARHSALPGYCDLPGFDQLRRGSVSDRFRNPIHWEDEILWLCSFDSAYAEQTNARTIRDKVRVVVGDQVAVRRLTEILSPELASQKLFDAIRRYKLCIVDWTQWSSNVFFEFGVRLAANPRAPICLVSDFPPPAWSRDGETTPAKIARHRAQIEWLERAFAAIRYRVDRAVDFDLFEIRHRIERMDQAEQGDAAVAPPTFGLFRYDLVYRTIAAETSADQQGLRPPIDLLKLAAAEVVGEASQRRLDIATLYADRNQELNDRSRSLALDYQVAAWRYARAEALWNPHSAEWKAEESRLAGRIVSLLNKWPNDDPRKAQLSAELDSASPEGASRS